MKIKIDILTSNKKHATDIAMLVDKQEFLQEIDKLRQKWQMTQLYELKNFPRELLNIDNIINSTSIDSNEAQKRLAEFNIDIDKVLKKFNRGKNFKLVVEYALVTGTVPEGIYKSCYFDVVKVGEPDSLENPEMDQYVIVLSPRTEQKEVVESYKEFKEHIKGKIKFHKPRISPESSTDEDFYKAIEILEEEKKLYSEQLQKLNNPDEIKKAYSGFLERTKGAQEYFQSIGELNIDILSHRDLIEQYHKGNIYSSTDIDKFKTLKELERTREWYWIRYIDYINGISKKPKTYEQVLKEWQKNCPINKQNQSEKDVMKHNDCLCLYCVFSDINVIEQALASYIKLLKQS